jgi:hypothetical protein
MNPPESHQDLYIDDNPIRIILRLEELLRRRNHPFRVGRVQPAEREAEESLFWARLNAPGLHVFSL